MGLSASQARYLALTARKSDNEFHAQQINQQRTTIASKMEELAKVYTTGMNNRNLTYLSYDESGKVVSQKLNYNLITSESALGYKLVDGAGREVVPENTAAQDMRDAAKAKYDAATKLQMKDENGNLVDVTPDLFMSKFAGESILKGSQAFDAGVLRAETAKMDAYQFETYMRDNNITLRNTTLSATLINSSVGTEVETEYKNTLLEADDLEKNSSYAVDKRCLDAEFLETQLRDGKWFLNRVNPDVTSTERENVHFGSVGQIGDELDTEDDASVSSTYDSQMTYFQHKDKELELELSQLDTSHNAIQTELDAVKKVIEKNVETSFKTFG